MFFKREKEKNGLAIDVPLEPAKRKSSSVDKDHPADWNEAKGSARREIGRTLFFFLLFFLFFMMFLGLFLRLGFVLDLFSFRFGKAVKGTKGNTQRHYQDR
ncbi:Hypothetical protein Minf_1979 [Methylacidiphilum infernorum V4]|uniref:Uncharacterized protein n=1 Tax=Methylacidiphilum infernorum (isolate V4) TaxID=481448 RepID=B3DYI5_METI4|nr:Hypothetical protein Minf_1979 [Methylacidiphilum infernorum V4]